MFKNVLKITCLTVFVYITVVLSATVEGFIGSVDYSYGKSGNLIKAKYFIYPHIGSDSLIDSIVISAPDSAHAIEYIYDGASSCGYLVSVKRFDLHEITDFIVILDKAYKNWIKINCNCKVIEFSIDVFLTRDGERRYKDLKTFIKNVIDTYNGQKSMEILHVPYKVTPENVQIKYLLSEKP